MECTLHMVAGATQSEGYRACIRIDAEGLMLCERGRGNRERDGEEEGLCVNLHCSSSPICNECSRLLIRSRDDLRQPKTNGGNVSVRKIFVPRHVGSGDAKLCDLLQAHGPLLLGT